jgi:hypothetical protein
MARYEVIVGENSAHLAASGGVPVLIDVAGFRDQDRGRVAAALIGAAGLILQEEAAQDKSPLGFLKAFQKTMPGLFPSGPEAPAATRKTCPKCGSYMLEGQECLLCEVDSAAAESEKNPGGS